MANTNAPQGLKPVRMTSGSPYTGPLRRYSCPATYATALFPGDPVVITGTADADGYSEVNLAAAGGSITGVVQGFEDATCLQLGYKPASTLSAVLVQDNPEVLYEVQSNGTTVAADIGLNADLVAAAGSVGNKLSAWQLNDATKATTATLQVKIIEFQHRADVEIGTANPKLLVKLNKITTPGGVAGV